MMAGERDIVCPICGAAAKTRDPELGDKRYIDCSVSGAFEITNTMLASLGVANKPPKNVALLNYIIRRAHSRNETLLIDTATYKRIHEAQSLPAPGEQAANFIRALGDTLAHDDPARQFAPDLGQVAAEIGASSLNGVRWVVSELVKEGYVSRTATVGELTVGLTFKGWNRYEQLQRAHSEGQIAFMAMPFNDTQLDDIFANCFKPAVLQAGFELRRIDDKPPAGLVDNRMRVEIRKSRFLVAELTNENRGVYWEAGFAEGLGKPVIFTCRKSYFDANPSHFDVSHQHTILWETHDLAKAAEDLKATIRATLPEEAKMTD